MHISSKACGPYLTNCYIINIDGKDFIIDPGMDAAGWVLKNVDNPVAILNTHGHFDHIWSDAELKKELNVPVYAPKNDIFMIKNDPFEQGTPSCDVDVEVDGDKKFTLGGVEFEFLLFPGHTPGCSVIIFEDAMFSGDFIFKGSIGRVDFPYSNPAEMKKSISRILKFEKDYEIYPGHGEKTTLYNEKDSLKAWLNYL